MHLKTEAPFWKKTFDGPFSRIVVYGLGGDDDIESTGCFAVQTWMFGGDGDDRLKGGKGANVLLGGDGNDQLYGGGGTDILIGGKGRDKLNAGSGSDLLIGGWTDYDGNEAALCALLKEWSRSDATYRQRVDHILGLTAGGLNGAYNLSAATVHNDNASDELHGSSGADLFFASVGDKVNRKRDSATIVWI